MLDVALKGSPLRPGQLLVPVMRDKPLQVVTFIVGRTVFLHEGSLMGGTHSQEVRWSLPHRRRGSLLWEVVP